MTPRRNWPQSVTDGSTTHSSGRSYRVTYALSGATTTRSCGFEPLPVEHWKRVRSPCAGSRRWTLSAEEPVHDEHHAARDADHGVGMDLGIRVRHAPRRPHGDGRQHAGLEVGARDDAPVRRPVRAGRSPAADRRRCVRWRRRGPGPGRPRGAAAARPSVTDRSAGVVQTSALATGYDSAAACAAIGALAAPRNATGPSAPGGHPGAFRQNAARMRQTPSAVPSPSQDGSPSRHETLTLPRLPGTPSMRHAPRHSSAALPPAAGRATAPSSSMVTMYRVGFAIVSLPTEETDTRTRRARRARLLPEFQLPPLGRCFLLAPGPEVFWLGDHPPPVPSRRVAVVATGFVPPHSCGAARASHPLP